MKTLVVIFVLVTLAWSGGYWTALVAGNIERVSVEEKPILFFKEVERLDPRHASGNIWWVTYSLNGIPHSAHFKCDMVMANFIMHLKSISNICPSQCQYPLY